MLLTSALTGLHDLPAGEIALLVAALLVAGLATGFLAGLLGIGGGGITAPVLYEVFGVLGVDDLMRMHLAVGTSLAVMVPTALRSFAAHHAKGSVDIEAAKRLAPGVLVGVVAGALVAKIAPGSVLKAVWVAFATVMSVKLFFGRDHWRLGETLPRAPVTELYGAFVGVVSTLISIGGGAFITTFLTLYGRKIQTAVGTSSGIGLMIALPGALGFMWAGFDRVGLPPLSIGYVSIVGVALLAPASVLAAPLGVRVAHGISRRALEMAFGAVLATIGLRFLLSFP